MNPPLNLPPGSKPIEQQVPMLWSTVLHNGTYDFELDINTRTVLIHFMPVGMPFIRVLTVPMPSLAFVQFYKKAQSVVDALSRNEEAESTEDNPPAA